MKKYLIEAIEKEKTALDALSAMSLQECERVRERWYSAVLENQHI